METVLLVILAVGFAVASSMKLLGLGPTKANFERWSKPVSRWLSPTQARLIVGVIELVIFGCAVAGLAGSASGTQLAGLVALWTMVGALVAHGMAGDDRRETIPAFALLIAAVALLATTT